MSAINLFFGRLAQTASGWVYPYMYQISDNLFLPMISGFVVCLFSVIVSFFVFHFDRKAERQDLLHGGEVKHFKRKPPNCNDLRQFPPIYWMLTALLLLNYSILFPLTSNIETYFKDK